MIKVGSGKRKALLLIILILGVILQSFSPFHIPLVKGAVEDFTTWTESDASNRLSQTSTRATFTDLDKRDTDTYLYKDFGVDGITDFVHEFEINVTAIDDGYNRASFIVYSNELCTQPYMTTPNIVFGFYETGTFKVRFKFGEEQGADVGNRNWSFGSYDLSTEYYIQIQRQGRWVHLRIYTDSDRTNMDVSKSVYLQSDYDFRYVSVTSGYGYGSTEYDASGYVENLNLSASYDMSDIVDFNDWTESDPHSRLSIEETYYVNVNSISRDDNQTWFYKDFGSNYFDDWNATFIYAPITWTTASSDNDIFNYIAFMNTVEEEDDAFNANHTNLYHLFATHPTVDDYTMYFTEMFNQVRYDNSTDVTSATDYYGRWIRISKNGTSYKLYFSSTGIFSSTETDSLTLHSDWSFQYCLFPQSLNKTSGGRACSMSLGFLKIVGIGPQEYTENIVESASMTTEITVDETLEKMFEDASMTTTVDFDTTHEKITEGTVTTEISTVLNPDTPYHTDSSYETNTRSATNLLKVLWDSTGSSVPATTLDSWIMSSNTSGSWVNSSIVSFNATQDVTVADEVDPNGYWSTSGTTVTTTQLPRGDDSYLSMDMGDNFFGESFKHRFKINTTAADPSTGGTIIAWSLDDSLGSYTDITPDAGFYMLFTGLGGGSDQVRLALTSGLSQIDEYNGTLYTPYWIQIERKGYLGTTLECKIYSNDGFSNLLDTLSITVPTNSWRYLYVGQSVETVSDPDYWLSGYMDEFLLYQDGAPQNAWSQYDITNPSTGDTVVGWRCYANNSQGNWGDTGIQTFTTPPTGNTAPENVNFLIENIDGRYVYINYKWYYVSVLADDDEGTSDISTIEFSFHDDVNWINATYTHSSETWSLVAEYAQIMDGVISTSGNRLNAECSLFVGAGMSESYSRSVWMRTTDTSAASTGWEEIQIDYFDLVPPPSDDGNGGGPVDDGNGEEDDYVHCSYDYDELMYWHSYFREMTLTELYNYCEEFNYYYSKFDTKEDLIERIVSEYWECPYYPPEECIFAECTLSDDEMIELLHYLETLTVEEIRAYCDDLGISYKPWGRTRPYIILIFVVGYGCPVPDEFYEDGDFDPDDWDDDGNPNDDDPDPYDDEVYDDWLIDIEIPLPNDKVLKLELIPMERWNLLQRWGIPIFLLLLLLLLVKGLYDRWKKEGKGEPFNADYIKKLGGLLP